LKIGDKPENIGQQVLLPAPKRIETIRLPLRITRYARACPCRRMR
jgi:hypothetical protein